MDALIRQWNARQVTNDLLLVPGLEQQINQLRTEKNKHEAAIAAKAARDGTNASEVRRRWYLPEEEGGFPISVKRTYIRSALHAVIMYPAGKGNKKFDPDLLDPAWRNDWQPVDVCKRASPRYRCGARLRARRRRCSVLRGLRARRRTAPTW
ncbi:hypothetical protein HUT06_39100 [Actinomadura sp. NAK00032]|uniref:hypothetical protein n=1 Tax=Actinomadura sp. NAK00032 TaxID=2742128 RepID=UPI001592A503|nr:hypothetical protein [Actinomadura sp. NAK00032]QKW39304.1 hypothetical protein HUT06_39100 [Actinomadura sp. NAK00032]